MAKAKFVPLDRHTKVFVRALQRLSAAGDGATLDDLNRLGVRLGVECLRTMGRVVPYTGQPPEVTPNVGRSSKHQEEMVRLGDEDQEMLNSIRSCFADGDGATWATMNTRALHMGEEFSRRLGLIGEFERESIFDDLVSEESYHGQVDASESEGKESDTLSEMSDSSDSSADPPSDVSASTPLKSPARNGQPEGNVATEGGTTSVPIRSGVEPEVGNLKFHEGVRYAAKCASCASRIEPKEPGILERQLDADGKMKTTRAWCVNCSEGQRLRELVNGE